MRGGQGGEGRWWCQRAAHTVLRAARSGDALPSDPTVKVRGGHLEGSNVSAVEEMIATMSLNRDFDLQMKLYKAADSMADAGNRLIRE